MGTPLRWIELCRWSRVAEPCKPPATLLPPPPSLPSRPTVSLALLTVGLARLGRSARIRRRRFDRAAAFESATLTHRLGGTILDSMMWLLPVLGGLAVVLVAATIAVGTVTTVDPTDPATVTNCSGTTSVGLRAVFTNATGGSPSALTAGNLNIYLNLQDAAQLP